MVELVGEECPACGADLAKTPKSRIAFCRACSHRWLPMTLAEQARAEKAIYTRDYAGYRQDPVLADNFDNLIRDVLAPRITRGGEILDVGCGGGAFLAAAGRAGFVASGLDVSEEAAQLVRDRGYQAESGDFTQTEGKARVAVITMWDVLEHLRNPYDFLVAVGSRLTAEGIFMAKVPTYGALSVTLSDRVPRLRRILLGAPDHVQYYNPRSLRALFDRSGLTVIEWREMSEGIRTAPTAGGMRKQAVRRIKAAIADASGEGNILVVAQRAS